MLFFASWHFCLLPKVSASRCLHSIQTAMKELQGSPSIAVRCMFFSNQSLRGERAYWAGFSIRRGMLNGEYDYIVTHSPSSIRIVHPSSTGPRIRSNSWVYTPPPVSGFRGFGWSVEDRVQNGILFRRIIVPLWSTVLWIGVFQTLMIYLFIRARVKKLDSIGSAHLSFPLASAAEDSRGQ